MPDFTAESFAAATHVSRETLSRLRAYAELLLDWNSRQNLVAASTLPDLWRRHFWDSAQLSALIPSDARTLADLGSGAGFPGLVLAAMRPELCVTLLEATGKKAAFLEAAAERLGVRVAIERVRLEQRSAQPFDIVTARALAPLPRLLDYAHPFTGPNSICLFPKGQNLGAELTEAHKSWKMETYQVPSQTDPSGAILVVRKLAPHDQPPAQTPGQAKNPGGRKSERRRR